MKTVICNSIIHSCTNQVAEDQAANQRWTQNLYGWQCPQCTADEEARVQAAKQEAAAYRRRKHPLLSR